MTDKEKNKENSTTDIVKRALARLALTRDGKVFLKYLLELCGFASSSIVVDTSKGEINTISTIYNEARKTVYYKIRSLIKDELLKEIEYLNIKEETGNEI